MPTSSKKRLEQADLLARAVENVVRKLIRFLVGRITLVRLQEMIRFIYVEETERRYKAENPGKNIPMTRLALSTGLDTRTLARVRQRMEEGDDQYHSQFLAQLTPESAVVEAWANLSPARPVLDYGSGDAGFEKLIYSTISMRGITPQSIIRRLVDTNSIAQDRENRRLTLLVDHYSPYLSEDEPNRINAAFSAISNLISTVEYNVDLNQEDKLFQRQAWSFRLEPGDRLKFRKAMRALLEDYERKAIESIAPWELDHYGDDLVTAGIGLYYFEEGAETV